jgi:phospholipase C
MHHCLTKAMAALTAAAITLLPAAPAFADEGGTASPIKHVVVIFQENVSFDHYFGTYPRAANLSGEPAFHAKADTPRVNNLVSSGLLDHNPNSANPFRIDRSVLNTCDQNHDYIDEQAAFHNGLMDKFVEKLSCNDPILGPASTMGYYDGNTVTAFWNYAQHFAMSDNSFSTTFGPSTPGALNLVAGTTSGATLTRGSAGGNVSSAGTVVGDPRPDGDKCVPATKATVSIKGTNVGDLLSAAGVTWGWFQGGFDDCTAKHTGVTGLTFVDYIPHHEPFQYFPQTANPNHLPPTGTIGHTDQANHQYDLWRFWQAVNSGNMPAVSFLKAAGYQDGHAGYSDPLDEQIFLVNTINALEKTPEWNSTAVIILYDDSDGWYDHQMGPIVRQSATSEDALLGPGSCGTVKGSENGRCGFGPRQPLLVISPFARQNYVDHRITDQSSVLRFIEDNWNLGRLGGDSTDAVAGTLNGLFNFDAGYAPRLFLDPSTGLIINNND